MDPSWFIFIAGSSLEPVLFYIFSASSNLNQLLNLFTAGSFLTGGDNMLAKMFSVVNAWLRLFYVCYIVHHLVV